MISGHVTSAGFSYTLSGGTHLTPKVADKIRAETCQGLKGGTHYEIRLK